MGQVFEYILNILSCDPSTLNPLVDKYFLKMASQMHVAPRIVRSTTDEEATDEEATDEETTDGEATD